MDALWSHQADALELVLHGTSTVLATGTASGKSLVAQAAIGAACAGPRPATALLLYPTKALGHDQLRALDALDLPGVVAAAYDGDSTDVERAWVRRHANVICTNPDMLHVGLLPRHAQWATFLRRLRYVVVDETHTLRGIFGGHVAHVLRRLRRTCAAVGADPTFIFASATVADAADLCTRLCATEVSEVTDDGSPRSERLVAIANPPLLDPTSGARASAHQVTARAAAALVEAGHRTIVFCRSRHATETVTAAMRRHLPDALQGAVQPYRAGYLAAERRGARGRPRRWPPPRRRRHQRARAGHRHRRARCLRRPRLPGNDRLVPSADRTGGTRLFGVARAARRRAGPARPVPGRAPRRALRPTGGAGRGERREPVRARPATGLRGR